MRKFRAYFALVSMVAGAAIASPQVGRPPYMGITQWYGKHLESMHEPALWRRQNSRKTVVRLLVLPTFSAPTSIRIQQDGRGWSGRRVTTDGKGGYDVGAITTVHQFRPSATVVNSLIQSMRAARFNERVEDKPLDKDEFGAKTNDTGEVVVCADGIKFVIELIKDQKYKIISRSDCELDTALRDLVQRISALGGLADPTSEPPE